MKRALLFLLLSPPATIDAGAACSVNPKPQSTRASLTQSDLAKLVWNNQIYPGIEDLKLFVQESIDELNIEIKDIMTISPDDETDETGTALKDSAVLCLIFKIDWTQQHIKKISLELSLLIRIHIKTDFARTLLSQIDVQVDKFDDAIETIVKNYDRPATEEMPEPISPQAT